MKHALLSGLAAACLMAGCASPARDFEVNATGETVTKYTGSDPKVVIPSKIEGEKITAIGDFAFAEDKNVLEVSVPEGVETIGAQAFSNSRVRSIGLPASSLRRIGDGAFSGCDGLTAIELPQALEAIGEAAFASSPALVSVCIPARVNTIGPSAFHGCARLQAIEVDPGNAQFSSENGVLYDRAKSRLLQYPDGKTDQQYRMPESVTGIEAGFSNPALEEVSVSGQVSTLPSELFAQCGSLHKVTIPEGVEELSERTFVSCPKLTAVTLPSTITNMDRYAFSHCANLEFLEMKAATPPAYRNNVFAQSGSGQILLVVPAGTETAYRNAWKFLHNPNWFEVQEKGSESFGEEI